MSRRFAGILLLCAAIGVSVALSARGLRAGVSAQDLLREAVRDRGPLEQIFGQQAGQGYYADALVTARLIASRFPRSEDQLSGMTKQLIEMRAENGDIQGAKEMIKQLSSSALGARGPEATLAVAKIQVDRGDLRGALESVVTPSDADQVMSEFGSREIANGDFDGALKTAEQISERSAYDLFYEVGDALRQRGEPQRLRELASHMADRKLAAEFVDAARFTLYPDVEVRVLQPTPCDTAWRDARIANFAEAYSLAEHHNCRYSDIALMQYSSDPAEAERELLKSPDKEDRRQGMARLTEAAAKNGDVADARRLLDVDRQMSGSQDYCPDCLCEIAWAWTLKGQPGVVLRWARSLPDSQQRGWALLGVAQALGHARPK